MSLELIELKQERGEKLTFGLAVFAEKRRVAQNAIKAAFQFRWRQYEPWQYPLHRIKNLRGSLRGALKS